MNKIAQRLTVFFIGIPAVVLIVLFNAYNHLLLHIIITLVSGIAVSEIYHLVSQKQAMLPYKIVMAVALCIPITACICSFFELSYQYIDYISVLCFFILFYLGIFHFHGGKDQKEPFDQTIQKISGSAFVILYGAYLITYISRMTVWRFSTLYISAFLIMIFMCDSFAWLFGILLGKNNKGKILASPNKSIAGFIGGFIGAVSSAIVITILFSDFCQGSYVIAVSLGIIVAAAGILGDLAESVCKRSARCKDSGRIILGRGGILDSIDSILFAAPVYYIVLSILAGVR